MARDRVTDLMAETNTAIERRFEFARLNKIEVLRVASNAKGILF